MTHTEEIAIEELVKKYIRENLSVRLATGEYDSSLNGDELRASLLLEGEIIDEYSVRIPERQVIF